MTLLTPAAALVACALLLPLVAAAAGAARTRRVRRALGLPPARRATTLSRLLPAAASVALLGAAAAQPVLRHEGAHRVRRDVQVLFVLDTSRSMAASAGRDTPTRLARAASAGRRLRAAIPDVSAGVATMTDRILPNLLPVPDAPAFGATVDQAVGIEEPPPRVSVVHATTFESLTEVPAGRLFAPTARRRVVVLLTDGESQPFDPTEVARAFAAGPRIRLLAVRFWGSRDGIFDLGGKADPAYHPDPGGRELLDALARATRGRAYEEHGVGAAESELRRLAETGPTVRAPGEERPVTPLAPYLAALALLPIGLVARRR